MTYWDEVPCASAFRERSDRAALLFEQLHSQVQAGTEKLNEVGLMRMRMQWSGSDTFARRTELTESVSSTPQQNTDRQQGSSDEVDMHGHVCKHARQARFDRPLAG